MDESSFVDTLIEQRELVAIAALVLGFLMARLISVGVGYALNAVDKQTARLSTSDASILSPRLIGFIRAFVFWLVLILSIALSLQILGIGGISSLLSGVIAFVPQALVGFVIVVVGHLLGLLARNLVTQLDVDLGPNSVVPRLVHGIFVVVALVLGLQQVNVDITFITRLILILIGITGGGLVLAFALGARRHVANLLAHRETGRLSVGDRIRIDEIEGTIVEIHNTGIDVATSEGIASIPAACLAETIVLRIREDTENG